MRLRRVCFLPHILTADPLSESELQLRIMSSLDPEANLRTGGPCRLGPLTLWPLERPHNFHHRCSFFETELLLSFRGFLGPPGALTNQRDPGSTLH